MAFTYTNQGVIICSNKRIDNITQLKYLNHIQKENKNMEIGEINLLFDNHDVECSYTIHPIQFERIRRITGYLVGNVERFNNGKKAEEKDRVKHYIEPNEARGKELDENTTSSCIDH